MLFPIRVPAHLSKVYEESCCAAIAEGGQTMVLIKESHFLEPAAMPKLPEKALTLSGFGQMAPDLLFHPVSNVRETSTGVTYSKVPNPTSQNRIDLID